MKRRGPSTERDAPSYWNLQAGELRSNLWKGTSVDCGDLGSVKRMGFFILAKPMVLLLLMLFQH